MAITIDKVNITALNGTTSTAKPILNNTVDNTKTAISSPTSDTTKIFSTSQTITKQGVLQSSQHADLAKNLDAGLNNNMAKAITSDHGSDPSKALSTSQTSTKLDALQSSQHADLTKNLDADHSDELAHILANVANSMDAGNAVNPNLSISASLDPATVFLAHDAISTSLQIQGTSAASFTSVDLL